MAPSYAIFFTNMYMDTGNKPLVYHDFYLGMSDNVPYGQFILRTVSQNYLRKVNFDILLFCNKDNDCLRPRNPDLIAGRVDSYLSGTGLFTPQKSIETAIISSAYQYFFQAKPKYAAIGLGEYHARGGFKFDLLSYDKNSINIQFTVFKGSSILVSTQIYYLLSNWGKY